MNGIQVENRNVLTATSVPGALIALLLPLTVNAQETPESSRPDTSKWSCSMCPFADGWAVDAEAGVISVSDDSAKFGDYTGLEEEGEELLLDGEVRYWGDSGYRLEAEGENLGLDSKSARLGVAKQGLWGWLPGKEDMSDE